MNDKTLARLAVTVRALAPDLPKSTREIHAAIKTQGLERFMQENSGTAELAEIAELLSRIEKRGDSYELGQPI